MTTATATSLIEPTIRPLSSSIGAMVENIDLRLEQSPQAIDVVYQALLDHQVIFFRDQAITTEQHLAFAKKFGELEIHPFAKDMLKNNEIYPEVMKISHNRDSKGRENLWHSDVTWRKEPSLGSILRATIIPEMGGDTLFANMERAYEDLDDDMKERLEGLTAMHDASPFFEGMKANGASDEEIEAKRKEYPESEHPVIRTHPDTGRKSIYVNTAFTQHIVGMDKQESDQLLDYLYSRAAIPEYQYRFRWEPNSIAFWDNRACQHYAVSDYWPQERSVERVTIMGDKPV